MAGPGGDLFDDLTTAPIFDDALYFSEALLLPVNETEDDVDTQLAMSARESGIEDPFRILCPEAHHLSTSLSMFSLQSDQGSSVSIHSRETQSTNFTSPTSRTSRDHHFTEAHPLHPPQSPARVSLSLDQDSEARDIRPNVRHRHSSSAFSAAASLLSTTSSARQSSTPKHKRSSGLFSMFRKDSGADPAPSRRNHRFKTSRTSSPHHGPAHSLSKYALRMRAGVTLNHNEDASPTQPAVTTILKNDSDDHATSSLAASPETGSLRDSGYSEDGMSTVDLSHTLDGRTNSQAEFPASPPEICQGNEPTFNSALAHEAFKSIQAAQLQQFHRVSLFESNQRKALASLHARSLQQLSTRLETAKAEREQQHPLELERLDEIQINAEHELRKAQALETQNVATALKYMDAYCSGAYPSSELQHTVTDEDLNKLEHQRITQRKLPAKHESAINVLRAKQERDTKLKLQKQETELQLLEDQYNRDRKAAELEYVQDSNRLDKLIQSRRERIVHRWDLKMEIWRKDWETQHETTLSGPLPHGDWPEPSDLDAPITPSSSLAIYNQIAS